MVSKKDKEMRMAGVLGVIVLVMIVALFIVGMSMIPDILLFVQTALSIDEFGSEVITFILLAVGIGVLSWISLIKYDRSRPKRKR